MTVSWNSVKAGDRLFTRTRQKMGSTTLRHTVEHHVKVISIDHEAGRAVISWNGNREENAFRRRVEAMFRNPMKRKDRPDAG